MPPASSAPKRVTFTREKPAAGSVFARMTYAEQRRFLRWLEGKSQESEEYIQSLMIR